MLIILLMKGIFVVQRELKINIHLEDKRNSFKRILYLYYIHYCLEKKCVIWSVQLWLFWLIKSCLFLFEFIESVEIRVIYFPINLFMNKCKIIMKKISLFIVCVIILFCVYVCTCEKRFLFHEFSEMTKIVFYDKINEMVNHVSYW